MRMQLRAGPADVPLAWALSRSMSIRPPPNSAPRPSLRQSRRVTPRRCFWMFMNPPDRACTNLVYNLSCLEVSIWPLTHGDALLHQMSNIVCISLPSNNPIRALFREYNPAPHTEIHEGRQTQRRRPPSAECP